MRISFISKSDQDMGYQLRENTVVIISIRNHLWKTVNISNRNHLAIRGDIFRVQTRCVSQKEHKKQSILWDVYCMWVVCSWSIQILANYYYYRINFRAVNWTICKILEEKRVDLYIICEVDYYKQWSENRTDFWKIAHFTRYCLFFNYLFDVFY
jgi:hypothetical protein